VDRRPPIDKVVGGFIAGECGQIKVNGIRPLSYWTRGNIEVL
jgi:hypothetical protein